MDNVTHHLVPIYRKVDRENVAGDPVCRYCNKGPAEIVKDTQDSDVTQYVCDAAVKQAGVELLSPEEWEKRSGVHILDPDGWRYRKPFRDARGNRWPVRSWLDPICEEEWDARMSMSTCDGRIR